MAIVPTPVTQVAGTPVPAATINSQGNLATYLAGRVESGGARKPLVVLRQTISQSIPNNTATGVAFDTEDRDYDNSHSTSTNTSRFTAQTAGVHAFGGVIPYPNSTTGVRYGWWGLNGVAQNGTQFGWGSLANGGFLTLVAPLWLVFLNVGDYVELLTQQTSGAALSLSVTSQLAAMMSAFWLST